MSENEITLNSPGMREKVLSIIPHFTGFLSILGSSLIAYQVLRSRERRHKTYHRLLLSLSLCDIVSSFGFFLSTWPLPQSVNLGWGNDSHYAAHGNDATCTMQATFIQFGMVAAFYNIALSLHFVLIVRYNVQDRTLKKWIEPFLIGVPLALALALTIPGIPLGIYGNTNLWCWIAPDFTKCTVDNKGDCVQEAYQYRWIFYYSWVWGSIFFIGVAQFLLFQKVRSLEHRAARWRGTASSLKRSGTFDDGTGQQRLSAAEKKQMKQDRREAYKHSRKIVRQALLYFSAFILTWLPYTLTSVTGGMRKFYAPFNNGFWLLLVIVIFQPLQGFFNFIIYNDLFSFKSIRELYTNIFCSGCFGGSSAEEESNDTAQQSAEEEPNDTAQQNGGQESHPDDDRQQRDPTSQVPGTEKPDEEKYDKKYDEEAADTADDSY